MAPYIVLIELSQFIHSFRIFL